MERLFVYGSLQPGGSNAHVLTDIGGEWQPAVVRGILHKAGWGADIGYPGLVLDKNGEEVTGYVFTSTDLAGYWAKLDAFEGEEYKRVLADVALTTGESIQAYVYTIRL